MVIPAKTGIKYFNGLMGANFWWADDIRQKCIALSLSLPNRRRNFVNI